MNAPSTLSMITLFVFCFLSLLQPSLPITSFSQMLLETRRDLTRQVERLQDALDSANEVPKPRLFALPAADKPLFLFAKNRVESPAVSDPLLSCARSIPPFRHHRHESSRQAPDTRAFEESAGLTLTVTEGQSKFLGNL